MKKLVGLIAFLVSLACFAQNSKVVIPSYDSQAYYGNHETFIYCPTTSCVSGQLYSHLPGGTVLSVVQYTAGSGMTPGTYTATATGGGCAVEPAIQVVVTSATTLGTITLTNLGSQCFTGTPSFAVATGGTPPTWSVSMNFASPQNYSVPTYAGANDQPLYNAISFPNGLPIYTGGTGVTSVTCATGYTCTNSRGELTIVGGTATTGTIATLQWGNYNGSNAITLPAAPGLCFVTQNGGAYNIGHGTPSTTALTITAGITVASATVTVDYNCIP